jgi:hypothetical protein
MWTRGHMLEGLLEHGSDESFGTQSCCLERVYRFRKRKRVFIACDVLGHGCFLGQKTSCQILALTRGCICYKLEVSRAILFTKLPINYYRLCF